MHKPNEDYIVPYTGIKFQMRKIQQYMLLSNNKQITIAGLNEHYYLLSK